MVGARPPGQSRLHQAAQGLVDSGGPAGHRLVQFGDRGRAGPQQVLVDPDLVVVQTEHP
jgi:hypothetical protein